MLGGELAFLELRGAAVPWMKEDGAPSRRAAPVTTNEKGSAQSAASEVILWDGPFWRPT